MNYHNITHDDMLNGEGIRTVLWLAGCNHCCKGCQNPLTWDVNGGIPFDEAAERELYSYVDKEWCSGLTLSGGDPMYPGNRADVLSLLMRFRTRYGRFKTVWMYTGFTYDQVKDSKILKFIDVLVDGEYVEEERNTQRFWVGSDNQVVWKKDEDGVFVPEKKLYLRSLSEEDRCRGEG